MTLAEMIQADFELRDDLEEITLYDSAAPSTTYDVSAKSGPVDYRIFGAGDPVGIESTDTMFTFSAELFSTVKVKQGWTIEDSNSVKWIVLSVQVESAGGTDALVYCAARVQSL